jgi:hypothetical protein
MEEGGSISAQFVWGLTTHFRRTCLLGDNVYTFVRGLVRVPVMALEPPARQSIVAPFISEFAAATSLQASWRGRSTLRSVRQANEENEAALKLQLQHRRRKAKARAKEAAAQESQSRKEHLAARRIHGVWRNRRWRTKNGDAAAHAPAQSVPSPVDPPPALPQQANAEAASTSDEFAPGRVRSAAPPPTVATKHQPARDSDDCSCCVEPLICVLWLGVVVALSLGFLFIPPFAASTAMVLFYVAVPVVFVSTGPKAHNTHSSENPMAIVPTATCPLTAWRWVHSLCR